MKHAERSIFREKYVATNIVKNVIQNLIVANLIDIFPSGALAIVKDLIRQWQDISKVKEEHIEKLEKIDWDKYWRYLVQAHS